MRKQTLFLIIGTAVMIILSVVMIIVINHATIDDPYTALFGEEIELRYKKSVEDFPGGPNFTYIDYEASAYNLDNEKVGDVYNVKIRNGYALDSDAHYGTIELLVGIDRDDMVYVSILELDQSTWTVMGIQAYIEETFNGIPTDDVESIPEYDAAVSTAGATATDSTGTIKETVIDVINYHFGIITDITPIRLARYQAIDSNVQSFNALDLSTDPASVLVKAELLDSSDAVIGYAIEASVSNSYGLLHIVVVTDETGEIIGAEFVDYGNSMFENQLTAALSNLVGLTMTDDLTSGFVVAAPTSPASVPSMEGLLTDVIAAYGHITNGGA